MKVRDSRTKSLLMNGLIVVVICILSYFWTLPCIPSLTWLISISCIAINHAEFVLPMHRTLIFIHLNAFLWYVLLQAIMLPFCIFLSFLWLLCYEIYHKIVLALHKCNYFFDWTFLRKMRALQLKQYYLRSSS